MAQFFFHIRHDCVLFEDNRGGEFADLEAAWNWAVNDVRQIISNADIDGPIDNHWVEICNSTGTPVATLPFARVTALQ